MWCSLCVYFRARLCIARLEYCKNHYLRNLKIDGSRSWLFTYLMLKISTETLYRYNSNTQTKRTIVKSKWFLLVIENDECNRQTILNVIEFSFNMRIAAIPIFTWIRVFFPLFASNSSHACHVYYVHTAAANSNHFLFGCTRKMACSNSPRLWIYLRGNWNRKHTYNRE